MEESSRQARENTEQPSTERRRGLEEAPEIGLDDLLSQGCNIAAVAAAPALLR